MCRNIILINFDVVRWDVPLYFLRIRWTLQKLLCSPRQAESITIRYPSFILSILWSVQADRSTLKGVLALLDHSSRKEVFQPHLPVRLPCYDLAPVTSFTLGRSLRLRTLGTPGFHGLTGGVYKARERIHRAMADARLLANPASRSRVADSDPN